MYLEWRLKGPVMGCGAQMPRGGRSGKGVCWGEGGKGGVGRAGGREGESPRRPKRAEPQDLAL